MLLEGLFPPKVRTAEIGIDAEAAGLFPEECRALAGAVERRRREFQAGRACARQAMRGLGIAPMAVPVGADRAPIWPAGVIGSISHNETRCAAALALTSDRFRAIGLDIEAAAPLDDAFTEEICTRREAAWLSRRPRVDRGLLLKAIFSAKECTYKCQYPLTGQIFDFTTIDIDLDIAAGWFEATFAQDVSPFRSGDRLRGRVRLAQGHIVTAMIIDS